MFDFRVALGELTEFNRNLVYGFDPESGPLKSNPSEEELSLLMGQYKDILEAYLHAQNVILPQIKETGLTRITSAMLLEWVTALHGYIGQSLMQIFNKKSGVYVDDLVFRWCFGADTGVYFSLFFCGFINLSANDLAKFLEIEYGMDYQSVLDFISLVTSMEKDEKYTIDESLITKIDFSEIDIKNIVLLNKLATAYHLGQLSPAEKSIVNKITKICMFPSHVPQAMQTWASNTVSYLQKVDPSNLLQVSEFLAQTFYALTAIHPFGNGNGRTATCLMNLFLRAFGYPSILLRFPGERSHSNSLYAKAFEAVETDLTPLKELISLRVKEAKSNQALEDDTMQESVILRFNLTSMLKETKLKYPWFNIEEFKVEFNQSGAAKKAGRIADIQSQESATCYLIPEFTKRLDHKIAHLKGEKNVKKMESPNNKPPFFLMNAQQKEKMVEKEKERRIKKLKDSLHLVSAHANWKYDTKSDIVWTATHDTKKAMEIEAKLKLFKLAEVKRTRQVGDNAKHVILCRNIDEEKLAGAVSMTTQFQERENKIKNTLKEQSIQEASLQMGMSGFTL